MSMSKESFMEMRKYFVLKIMTDNLDGITGYQLQEEYHFPRTNVLRMLDKLEQDKYVKTKEETIDGRANKLYILTDKGIKYMEELKEKWGERFAMMSDTTMPFFSKGEKFLLMRTIETFKSKEDAIDFFRGQRSKIKLKQDSLERKLEFFIELKEQVNFLIQVLEKQREYDPKELVKQIDEWWEKMQNKNED
jgi:DNA-binding PadR family transcriptional regulator